MYTRSCKLLVFMTPGFAMPLAGFLLIADHYYSASSLNECSMLGNRPNKPLHPCTTFAIKPTRFLYHEY